MNITVRNATKEDLPEITKVHMECFPDYFSTKLGSNLLCKYYGMYLEERPELFFVACDEDTGNIIGLANGYVFEKDIQNEFIKKNFLRMIFRIMWLLVIFDKMAWKRIKGMIIKEKPEDGALPGKPGTGDLLSICVLDDYKGCGAAKQLVENVEQGFLSIGIDEYVLTVFTDNKRARAFYEKCGFNIYYETKKRLSILKK